MKKIGLIAITIFFVFRVSAQVDNTIEEKTRLFIFTSIESDGPRAFNGETWDNWMKLFENHYKYLNIESTGVLNFVIPFSTDSIADSYSLELFKVLDNNSKNQSRYLFKYKDFNNTVWLRVSGYIENDLNLLFDYLKRKKISKKQLNQIVNEWNSSNKIFEELNLQCLFKGYLNHNTSSECFRSVFYIKKNDASYNELLKGIDLNSKFSRAPLYDIFRE